MRSKYWMKKRLQRYEELKKNYDFCGLRRLKFGAYIARMRALIGEDYSQRKAAKKARITRIQWNRIENGHVVPRSANIRRIAYAVNADPVDLFKMLGLAVPEKYTVYDRKGGHRKLDFALRSCKYLSDFLKHMAFLWRQYQYEQMMIPYHELYNNYPSAYTEFLAQILAKLPLREMLPLARELVHTVSRGVSGWEQETKMRLYEEIDDRLAAVRIERFIPAISI